MNATVTSLREVDPAEVAQVDISDLTPNEIAKRLIVLGRQLYAKVAELRDLGEVVSNARKDAKVAYAKAFLEATGPMDVRRQEAELAAADARLTLDIAEQELSACKEALKAIHAMIDVGRSLSATTRDEMRMAGVGGA
ncbi:hypothetical protein ACGFNU_21655 [Spirillospora sp. NPDC048911]|uniref:hypothetical protein n=1 Tax=Spirillospora sp. NPDC048911 TaxID=3364527 RepID=UPI00371110AD